MITLLALGLFLFVQTLKPTYEGEETLAGLSEDVPVFYDPYGIPHIYGATEEDAIRALGYVHAQDRLWQMELLRRIAPGRLSEVFGSKLLDTDRFFIALGIDDVSAKTVSQLDADRPHVQLAQAYLDGINQFIDKGPTPVEYYLTGLEKSPFTLKDIHNSIGYMAFSFAMAHKTDPLLSDIKNDLGPAYLEDLQISVDPNTQWIRNHQWKKSSGAEADIVAMANKALDHLPVPQFIGSNSWVLSPKKTRNGAVILANDPHIGFAQPSVWYEAHLVTPDYEKYGFHLAGIPFPLLAHNRDLAYGMTMFENDDTDFYYEKINPSDSTQYWDENEWKDFETITKTIEVKDSATVTFTYRKSVRGPVLNGIAKEIKEESPISMSWIFTRSPNRLLESLYGISHAKNMDEFKAALPLLHAPGLNLMYGDAYGNIAWWAAAQLYQMADGINTKFILDGSNGAEEPIRYMDFSENPHAENPPWNYVYSANNQPDTIAGYAYPGYYLSENRAKRIVHLLDFKSGWTKRSVASMVTDVVSSVNPAIAYELISVIDEENLSKEEKRILDRMRHWNGNNKLESREAPLYHKWIYHLLKNTFEDELGEERFSQLLRTHLLKRQIAPLVKNPESVWWDDLNTDQEESRKDIVTRSLNHAFESLKKDFGPDMSEWTWDKMHTLEHRHPIGEVKLFRSLFNVGPFPIHGTREVINNMAFPYNSDPVFKVTSGPSTRRVIDYSDIENSWSILPTGQSGNPFSEHYDDQAELYNNGQFRKMMLDRQEIIDSTRSVLLLKAK